jgi:hypothetical protein
MTYSVTAFPLAWPDGWPRTPLHERISGTQFKMLQRRHDQQVPVSFEVARNKLARELDLLGARNAVLSTNIPLRLDGVPRASAEPDSRDDPGVAVYFTLKGRQLAMACDRYVSVAANCRSLGLAIEGLRQLERHGGGAMTERAFAGFAALPAPGQVRRHWRTVFSFDGDTMPSEEFLEKRFRDLAKHRHPDRGGSAEMMVELNEARDQALRAIGAR